MTDSVAAPATPEPAPSPAALTHDAYSRLDPSEQSTYSQVKRPDGDGSHWVRRADLEASATTTTQTLPRPAWVPEQAWDAQKGLDHTKFDAWYRESVAPAVARYEADLALRAALPTKPTDYAVATSPNFKLPNDLVLDFKLDTDNPMWAKAQEWAHRNGLSKEAFQAGIDIIAGRDLFKASSVKRAIDAEIARLGPTGPTRIAAIEAAYADILGSKEAAKLHMSRVWTSSDVKLHEAVIAKLTTGQGGSTPRQQPGKVSDAEFAAMTPSEKWEYARQHSGAR
jgi:hypothetical protein